jgi:hypothetical protein
VSIKDKFAAFIEKIMSDIPFDMSYVLRVTTKHMRQSIDVSIRKTFARVKDFDGDAEKSREVFNTLSILHQLRKQLDDFQSANVDSFRGKQ